MNILTNEKLFTVMDEIHQTFFHQTDFFADLPNSIPSELSSFMAVQQFNMLIYILILKVNSDL